MIKKKRERERERDKMRERMAGDNQSKNDFEWRSAAQPPRHKSLNLTIERMCPPAETNIHDFW